MLHCIVAALQEHSSDKCCGCYAKPDGIARNTGHCMLMKRVAGGEKASCHCADLRGKELVMRLMVHPDAEVQKQALLCVQKIMLAKDKVEYLAAKD